MNLSPHDIQVPDYLLRGKDPEQIDVSDLLPSVMEKGILQPLLVRDWGEGQPLTLVAGYRRLLAAKLAGLKEVPVVRRAMTDAEEAEYELIENLARKDLPPHREAEAILRLLAYRTKLSEDEAKSLLYRVYNAERGLTGQVDPATVEEVKKLFVYLGRSFSVFVSEKLPALGYNPDVLEAVEQYGLSLRDARKLNKIRDAVLRAEAIQQVAAGGQATQVVSQLLSDASHNKEVNRLQSAAERVEVLGMDERGYIPAQRPMALPEASYVQALSREHLLREIITRLHWVGQEIALLMPEPEDVLEAVSLGCTTLWLDVTPLAANCHRIEGMELPGRSIAFARLGEGRSDAWGDPSESDPTRLVAREGYKFFSSYPVVVAPLEYAHLFSLPISLVAVEDANRVWAVMLQTS